MRSLLLKLKNLIATNRVAELLFLGILIFLATRFWYGVFGMGCPIRFVTGVSCPGCGMTRAYASFAHGHVEEAFSYHPLFWSLPFWFALWWFRRTLPRRIYHMGMYFFILLFLAVYFYRMVYATTPEIVYFHPEKNLLARGIQYFT